MREKLVLAGRTERKRRGEEETFPIESNTRRLPACKAGNSFFLSTPPTSFCFPEKREYFSYPAATYYCIVTEEETSGGFFYRSHFFNQPWKVHLGDKPRKEKKTDLLSVLFWFFVAWEGFWDFGSCHFLNLQKARKRRELYIASDQLILARFLPRNRRRRKGKREEKTKTGSQQQQKRRRGSRGDKKSIPWEFCLSLPPFFLYSAKVGLLFACFFSPLGKKVGNLRMKEEEEEKGIFIIDKRKGNGRYRLYQGGERMSFWFFALFMAFFVGRKGLNMRGEKCFKGWEPSSPWE